MLPGYVFVYMENQPNDFEGFYKVDGIIRILGTEDGLLGLQNSDYTFAMNLYQKDGLVGAIKALKEGDNVRIQDPLFESFRGTVIQIDHRKQRANVQFRFDEKVWSVWMACDLIYLDKTNTSAAHAGKNEAT